MSFLLPWDTGCWWYKRVGRLSPCPKRAASCPGSAVRLLQVLGRSLSTRWGWPFSAGSPTGPVVPWHLIQVNSVFAFIGVNYLPWVGFWASPILCEFSKYFLLKYGCCKCSSMVSVLHLPETKFKKKTKNKTLELSEVPNGEYWQTVQSLTLFHVGFLWCSANIVPGILWLECTGFAFSFSSGRGLWKQDSQYLAQYLSRSVVDVLEENIMY